MCASPDATTYQETVADEIGLPKPSADDWVSPDSIRPNPDNPRLIFDQKRIDELKESIYEVGILQPLIVFERTAQPDTYMLIDGERRWRCALELNLTQVPVHVHQ